MNIIRDPIQKHLVSYVSNLCTINEMHDKFIGVFKSNNANQNLFLKNMLKGIKMDRGEPI